MKTTEVNRIEFMAALKNEKLFRELLSLLLWVNRRTRKKLASMKKAESEDMWIILTNPNTVSVQY